MLVALHMFSSKLSTFSNFIKSLLYQLSQLKEMATVSEGRYSTASVAKSETAKSFAWEAPVPVNRFWDSISYCVSRNFLNNFSEQELERLPIDPNSSASDKEKLEHLLHLLQEKLATEEAATAPKTLSEIDYARWNRLSQAIYTMQSELGLPESYDTIRLMVDKRPDKSNMLPLHILADHLVKIGKYEEAEETEKPVLAWMDGHERLGRDSPQAVNARRIIARALWKQGPSRRAEAEALIAEIREIIDGMGSGQFGVYQQEERRLTDATIAALEKEAQ